MSHSSAAGAAPYKTSLILIAALALACSAVLLPGVGQASSSSPGTDKYFIELYPHNLYAKFPDLPFTMQGGTATACALGASAKHVGDYLTIELYRKGNDQKLFTVSLKLTEGQTTTALGQVDGLLYTARIFFASDTPVCSTTWSQQNDLWYLTISSN